MKREDITKKVIDLLALQDFTVLPDQHKLDVRKNLGMDSLEFVEWWMNVEKHFKISITDAEAAAVNNVNDMVTLIAKKLND